MYISLFKCVKKGRAPILEILPESTLVDDAFFSELDQFKWFLNAKGYVRRKVNVGGKTVNYAMHSEVMRIAGVHQPDAGYTVDHINGDKLNNCLDNLRWANPSQQGVNKLARNGSIVPRGVYRRGSRFVAQLTSQSKCVHIYIGTFDSAEEASAAFEAKWAEVNQDLLQFRRA